MSGGVRLAEKKREVSARLFLSAPNSILSAQLRSDKLRRPAAQDWNANSIRTEAVRREHEKV